MFTRSRKTISPRDAQAQRDRVQFVDVREVSEWTAGHIDGSVHIPLGELQSRLAELEPDQPVVVVCRSGSRSGYAASFLNRAGHDASNLVGGVKAWVADGLPLRTPDGRRGRVV
jgi:rhodanese-related sulfurtransferase